MSRCRHAGWHCCALQAAQAARARRIEHPHQQRLHVLAANDTNVLHQKRRCMRQAQQQQCRTCTKFSKQNWLAKLVSAQPLYTFISAMWSPAARGGGGICIELTCGSRAVKCGRAAVCLHQRDVVACSKGRPNRADMRQQSGEAWQGSCVPSPAQCGRLQGCHTARAGAQLSGNVTGVPRGEARQAGPHPVRS